MSECEDPDDPDFDEPPCRCYTAVMLHMEKNTVEQCLGLIQDFCSADSDDGTTVNGERAVRIIAALAGLVIARTNVDLVDRLHNIDTLATVLKRSFTEVARPEGHA